jgi:benzoyl-CoA 2,3-dioxygenase component B
VLSRIQVFDDWVALFNEWKSSLGLDLPYVRNYEFDVLWGELKSPEIRFGSYKGRDKWERVRQIPDQRIRDSLLSFIVYQGDTEFASVEQQRGLIETAPYEEDLNALLRVMCEEMRHGYQMCALMVEHFGESGRIEAQKQLERRATANTRLLGAFNQPVNNWVDFFVYTDFVDRDGKFQLKMLSDSAFAPLARSTTYMLKEEAFHMGTGHMGVKRIAQGEGVPVPVLQKFINKWISVAYDLFGTDSSSTAHWAYVWGLKSRYDEEGNETAPPLEHMNEAARDLYKAECEKLIEQINRSLPEGGPRLRVPDLKFNRAIGDLAGATYSADGEPLSAEESEKHLRDALPQEEDYELILAAQKEEGWIAPPKGAKEE